MKILFFGIGIFFTVLLLHFLIWRARIPRNQKKALIILILSVLAAALLSCYFISSAAGTISRYLPHDAAEYIHIALVVLSLAAAYIATYPLIEVDSPTLALAICLNNAGEAGLNEEKIKEIFNDDRLVKARIADLVEDKMIYHAGDKYRLTRVTSIIVAAFVLYRKLLNIHEKGG